MNVSLTTELEAFVQGKIESGLYGSASEVVREALRLLREKDEDRQARIDRLRGEIQVGADQLDRGEIGGDGAREVGESVKRDGRARRSARKRSA